jgi:5-formyltetrahydrofolate cyclo-ligase
MTEKDVAEAKRALRQQIRNQRVARVLDPELASIFCAHLAELSLSIGAKKIAAYLPYADEPDIELFLDWALEQEIEVVLPVANQDGSLSWVRFDGSSTIGIHGFAEASGSSNSLDEIDLAVVPALAIGVDGIRLGKGKGYYDRALEKLDSDIPVVAVIFDEELLEHVPGEQHDLSVSAVLTPGGFTYF